MPDDIGEEKVKEALKEALKEWLDEKFMQLGKFTFHGIMALLLAGLIWSFIKTSGFKLW